MQIEALGLVVFTFIITAMIENLKKKKKSELLLQRSRSFQNEIWSGSFSVPGIESTQMAREQTEPPKLAIGKLQEKTGKWCVNLL